MSRLLQTIKFKNLASELTDDEFDEFLCSLHRGKGRALILRSLCQQRSPSLTADMLQITSNIIQKRHIQQQAHNPWTFDTLPKSLIGEIASNLNQNDYARFSRANRAVFIGCNDPNQLLSISRIRRPIRISQYPKLQKLQIHGLILRDGLVDANDHIFGQLQSLFLGPFGSESDWLSILAPNRFETPQLRQLTVAHCTFPSADIARSIFVKFRMIRHLCLSFTYFELGVSIPIPLITASFPNLQSLKLQDCDLLGEAFLKHRGSDLYQLDLDLLDDSEDDWMYDNLQKIKFSKLERFRVDHRIPSEITQHIIETASNLISACYVIEDEAPEKSKISQFINGVLTKSGKSSHLYVSTDDSKNLECISRTIEFALQSTRKSKKTVLRIGIECTDNVEMNETLVLISRMLNQLLLCDVHEHALFVQLATKQQCRESLMKDVKVLVADLGNVELVRSEGCVFIIRSKGSNINSYKKWWKQCKTLTTRVIY